MDSASFEFVFLGIAAALLSNMNHSRRWRSAVLMLASLLFLLLLSPGLVSLVPLAAFLLLGYLGLVILQRGHSRMLPILLILVVGVYVWLKKYTFLPDASFLRFPYFTLGLSYIFFRVLHLLIEAGELKERQIVGPFHYLLYTVNFTTFVSGPIQNYDEFARDQFAESPIGLGWGVVGLQVERIIRGFFKVNVLAMLFDLARNDALRDLTFSASQAARLFAVCRLVLAYPLFLYCNFSGYIDIVIAIARLMRVRLPENFDRPFSASSFLDFWSRWHITLSKWFKTYVYNPLVVAMMRRITSQAFEPFIAVVSFFATFFLVGLWHGRTSEFVVYGALQGGGISINKLWQIVLTRRLGRKRYNLLARNWAYAAVGRGLTFSYFALTLFWLWGDWKQIHQIFSALTAGQWAAAWVFICLCVTIVLELWERTRSAVLSIANQDGPVVTQRYALTIFATALCLIAFVMNVMLNQAAPDIVYKTF